MKLLLDTHTVLWFWWNDPQLSKTALRLICDPANQKFVSWATPWEVSIKVSQKRLDLGGSPGGIFHQHMLRNHFEWLGLREEHFDVLAAMPFHHKDPFDRMIVAQSSWESIPLISADAQLDAYGITRIW